MTEAPDPTRLEPAQLQRFRRHLAHELEHVTRYRALAERATGEHREVLLQLAEAEEHHARYWEQKLTELGVDETGPGTGRGNATTRVLAWLSRPLGVRLVVPLLERLEAAEVSRYDAEPQAGSGMVAQERLHAELVASLAPSWRTRASGSLRAAVFGVNDGVVSNLSLVMGMVGGGAGRSTVLLAALAGLVAGAGSMAAGEYISVRSQRELLQGVTRLAPDAVSALEQDEREQLELLLRRRGMGGAGPEDVSRRGAAELDVDLARLGSPGAAAGSSFVAFAAGAFVPVVPFLFSAGLVASMVAAVLAAVVLFVVGGSISLVTNRPALRSGGRQLLVGAAAAAGTWVVGAAVGVAVG